LGFRSYQVYLTSLHRQRPFMFLHLHVCIVHTASKSIVNRHCSQTSTVCISQSIHTVPSKRNDPQHSYKGSLAFHPGALYHAASISQSKPNRFHTPNTSKKRTCQHEDQKRKHTTGGIPRWSPTLVLVARFSAYVWQSGRDAQFSLTYGRMCLLALSPI
jgi:hypothetical protein